MVRLWDDRFRLRAGAEPGAQGPCHLDCDLLLQGEYGAQLAVVALRPHPGPVSGIHEAGRDADAASFPSDAPLQEGIHAQAPPYLGWLDVLPLEVEGRRPTDDLEPLDTGQRVQDFLGDAVGQVLLVFLRTHVREREHGDGRFAVRLCNRPRHTVDCATDDHTTEDYAKTCKQHDATHSCWPLARMPRRLEKVQPRLPVPWAGCQVGRSSESDGSVQPSRASPPQHLAHHSASGVHIGPLVHLATPGLLGCHVRRCPRTAHALGAQQMREPEVEELHATVVAEEDIGGLQVPVQHATLVRVGEPLRHLLCDAQRLRHWDRPLGQPLRERSSLEKLHDEVRTARAVAHIEQGDDAGMAELGHGLSFLFDPACRELLPGPAWTQCLDGNTSPEFTVERLIDRSEPSPPNLLADLEAIQAVAGLEASLPCIEDV